MTEPEWPPTWWHRYRLRNRGYDRGGDEIPDLDVELAWYFVIGLIMVVIFSAMGGLVLLVDWLTS